MRFKVPQNVDIEDRIIGPLTGKQFLWLIGGAILIFFCYKMFDFSLFILTAVIIGGIACAFAFIRPYSQPLIVFLGNFLMYNIKGKQYVWKSGGGMIAQKKNPPSEVPEIKNIYSRKEFPYEKVEQISKVLDNPDDYINNPEIEKLITKKQKKK